MCVPEPTAAVGLSLCTRAWAAGAGLQRIRGACGHPHTHTLPSAGSPALRAQRHACVCRRCDRLSSSQEPSRFAQGRESVPWPGHPGCPQRGGGVCGLRLHQTNPEGRWCRLPRRLRKDPSGPKRLLLQIPRYPPVSPPGQAPGYTPVQGTSRPAARTATWRVPCPGQGRCKEGVVYGRRAEELLLLPRGRPEALGGRLQSAG